MRRLSLANINLLCGLALICSLSLGAISYKGTTTLSSSTSQILRIRYRISLINSIALHLRDAESGQRGYLLIKKDTYLSPYREAVKSLAADLKSLDRSYEEDESKQKRLQDLKLIIQAKLSELAITVDLRTKESFDAALKIVQTDAGHSSMNQAQKLLEEMLSQENLTLFSNTQESQDLYHKALQNILIGSLFAGLIVIIGGIILNTLFFRNRETQDALANSQSFLNLLIENLPQMVFIKNATTLEFLKLNRAGEELLGVPRERILGKTDLDLFPEQQAQDFISKDQKILQSDLVHDISEEWVYTKAGKKMLHTKKVVLTGPDGHSKYLIGIAEDITEKKNSELRIKELNENLEKTVEARTSELRKSEAQIRLITDALPTLISYIDPQLNFQFSNSAYERWYEIDRTHMIGKSIQEVLGEKALEDTKEYFNAALSGQLIQYEASILNNKKEKREVNFTYIPDEGESGQIRGVIVLIQDLTERKRQEEERLRLTSSEQAAIEASRLKSEFLANMSHEIRTPMNGIIGMTGLLLDTPLNFQQNEFAETIRASADALLTIINDILDFSKIEAGKLTFEKMNFDLRHTIEGTVELLAQQAYSKGLEIATFIDNGVPTELQGDPGRLRQILLNLLSNGVKFTKQGEVFIRVSQISESPTHSNLKFEVKDTGIGIEKNVQDRLFQAFTQADGSTARKFGGTGLGLVISRQLVELMNGKIGIESEIGKGSTFWFTAEFEKQLQKTNSLQQHSVNLAGLRVLIVDDNITNQTIIRHQVQSWGMETGVPSGPKEAIQCLRDAANHGKPYDLLITDMNMPEIDGLSLAKTIKEDSLIQSIRIIMMTSLCSIESNISKSNGIAAVLTKPVKQSSLQNCIQTVLLENKQQNQYNLTSSISHLESKIQPETKQQLRILVAEDNPVNLKIAVMQLKKLGYSPDTVGNGIEALEALANIPYHLVLMDCQMPEMDGYQTTRELRKIPGNEKHPVIIAMTANALQGDQEKCRAAGMDDYISKPVKIEDLSKMLEHWSEIILRKAA